MNYIYRHMENRILELSQSYSAILLTGPRQAGKTTMLRSLAEKENKANLRGMCDLLFGLLDVCSFILIILPLYPNRGDDFVYSVNLFEYTQITSLNRLLYWMIFISLIAAGVIKLLLNKLGMERYNRIMTGLSMVISVLAVLLLAITREPYAIVVVFLLLVIKGCLLFKCVKIGG